LSIGFLTVRLVRIYTDADRAEEYANIGILLTVFAALSIVVNAWTLGCAVQCLLNFDKGLKPFLVVGGGSEQQQAGGPGAGPGRARMLSLDDDDLEEDGSSGGV